jgi:CHASE3 domain sensor protein
MKILLVILIIAMMIMFSWSVNHYQRIIESQAETIRILQEQVNDLRSRLFEFRAMVGGVG